MTQPLPMKALQRLLKDLVDDLRRQASAVPELREILEEQYGQAYGHRTGETFEQWREEQLDQAAVAWLLGTVFVRFCEDNRLVSGLWLAGPDGRTEMAVQTQTAYVIRKQQHNHRYWILDAFSHLRELRATSGIFDAHNPVWRFPLSADAADALLDFWRRGPGVHSFVDERLDTRFLGDLYQDLSEYARKRYALLQTPEFVEEFILELTLTPSIAEYGLADTSVIDPTCGSGHFLLGAFTRLHKLWQNREPATASRVLVQRALDQVTGVDLNPFAVAIARFRLLVAALRACGERSLETVPFRLRLAAGDSLLRWGPDSSHQGDLVAPLEGREEYPYFTEDAHLLAEYLRPGQYTVAVGNPPFKPVKDKILNRRYRELYSTCSGKYALSVPFAERFFELVRQRDGSGLAGFVGQITANSFMKREFGKKLIEQFFAHKVELSHVIDTSGAYIPGHGTPTVILAGRRRIPRRETVRAVLGVLGEPTTPVDPAKGLVWTAIVNHHASPDETNPYVTVADRLRLIFSKHPWSLAGGVSASLLESLDQKASGLLSGKLEGKIGFASFPGLDEGFLLPAHYAGRLGLDDSVGRPAVIGEVVRDWWEWCDEVGLCPYDNEQLPIPLDMQSKWAKHLWPLRAVAEGTVGFGQQTRRQSGDLWWTWYRWVPARYQTPLSIAFAFVATHNHFVLDRGGKVFKQTAPVIKLPQEARADDHLALLGLLNSSTACFWIKQTCYDRGNGGIGGGIAAEDWERFYEITGTKLKQFPVPAAAPTLRARRLDGLAHELAAVRPSSVAAAGVPTQDVLDKAYAEYDRLRLEMIAVQEELDWEVYRLYGLIDEELTVPEESMPLLNRGERAFEIVLARRMAAGETQTEWFARHGSTPTTEIPGHWPEEYRKVVERRIEVIVERPDIALIERPECKRRWASTPWEVQEKEALRSWLLDRLEAETFWREAGRARVLSVAQLADRVGVDRDFRDVVALSLGREDYDLAAELTKLVADEAVPFLAAYRYKPSGLRKREQWERTWDLQRWEDRGETLDEPIPVPPKYQNTDFAKVSYWRNRGKLDVPKERFVLYPKAGREADRTPVIGWAGWDHLDQAQALATLYINRKSEEGWPPSRLLPLLAGLVELEPWLHQWHSEPAAGYPVSPAAFYTTLIDTELAALGYGRADLAPEKLP